MTTPTHARLRIRLLGPLDVRIDDRLVEGLYTRKAGLLLATLIQRAGRSVPRKALAELLWPEQALVEGDLARALDSLRQGVSHLRKILGAEAWRIKAPSPRTILFDLAAADVDLPAFVRLAASDDAAPLREAIDHYSGPFLEGMTDPWVVEQREQLSRMYVRALEKLAEFEIAGGDESAAVDLLRRAVRAEPGKESNQRRLIELLGRTGQYTAATEVFGALRDYLHREHNASPASETTALYRRLLSEARAEARKGAHANGGSGEVPTVQDGAVYPSSAWPIRGVSRPATTLIGRELEVAVLEQRLKPGRLLTITGAGGVGKTRLGIAVAERVAPALLEGAAYVDLAPLVASHGKAEMISAQVARVLEVRDEPGKALIDCVAERIRDAEMLLILDNCEPLGQDCANVAQRLLARCPRLQLLATSRSSLQVAGEVLWRAPSLAFPPTNSGSTTLTTEEVPYVGRGGDGDSPTTSFPAVQLFLERAKSVVSDYDPGAAEIQAIGRVCAMLDGIPLAIELAAARIRLLSASQIEDRLTGSIRLLATNVAPRAEAPDDPSLAIHPATLRHQTMQVALDWSFQLLTEPEQRLLHRLSVFAGSASIEAIETICADEFLASTDILDELGRLVDHSLVVVDRAGGPPRYRLLEVIRQYSRDIDIDGEAYGEVQKRFVAWFLNVAEQAELHLMGPASSVWLDLLERERSNLMAALESAITRQDGESASGLAYSLWRYWEVRGQFNEGRTSLAAVLGLPTGCLDTALRARLLNAAGNLSRAAGDFATASAEVGRAFAGFQEIGNRKGMASALNNLASIAREQGDMPTSRELCVRSLAIYRELGDESGAADLLNNLGNIAWNDGDYADAAAYYRDALAVYERIGNQLGMGLALNNLGNIAKAQGNRDGAREYYRQSLRMFQLLDHGYAIASLLHNLGETDLADGNAESARGYLEKSLERFETLGSQAGLVESLDALAQVLILEGRWESAVCLFGAVDKLREVIGAPVPDSERGKHDAAVDRARAELSDNTFEGARRAGRTMTTSQAVELARTTTGNT